MKRTMGRYAKPGRILALLLCLLLLIGMLPSFGALGAKKKKDAAMKNNTGSLNVTFANDILLKLPKQSKVEFTLYQIGQAAPETTAGWTIDSDFSKYKILQASTSEDLGRAAAELAAKVVADGKYKGTTKALSSKGVAEFTGLAYGVYLGVMTKAPEALSAAPFIATLPSKDPETKLVRYDYDVTVKAEITEVKHDAVKIYKRENVDQGLLPGVEFTLYNGKTAIKTFSTDVKGELTIRTDDSALAKHLPKPGEAKTLTLKETKAAKGYVSSDKEYKVVISAKSEITVGKDENRTKINTTTYTIAIEGKKSLTVWNRPQTDKDEVFQAVEVVKVNNEDALLSGAEFTLYDGKTAIRTYTSGSDGRLSITTSDKALAKYLPAEGKTKTLELVETRAPRGYKKSDTRYTVVLSTRKTTEWNEDHTVLVTKLIHEITINDKQSVSVVNEPEEEPEPDTPTGGGGVPQPTAAPVIEIPVKKVWDDGGNMSVRPDSITVTLTGGSTTMTVTLDESNGWSHTFTDLPKYDGSGSEIEYRISEEAVRGYKEPSIGGDAASGFTITNIYRVEPQYDTLEGDKSWIGSKRLPPSVTFTLVRDDGKTYTCTTNAGLDWHFRFDNVETVDEYGIEHTFKLRESSVEGYFTRHIDDIDLQGGAFTGRTTVENQSMPESPPPTPGGTTPNVPQRPEDIPDRGTGTPVPHFEDKSDEELEELFDIFGYNTPLYGILGTGDQIPVWVWICVGIGILAIVLFVVLGRKKKSKG